MDDGTARARVLDTANELFYQRGIQAVSMDTLRNASGISLKRLYRLFPSKDAIVEEVLHATHATWTSWISAATAGIDDPRDQLLAVYDMLARWFSQDGFRGCFFINSFGELGAVNARVAEIVRAHKAEFQDTVGALVTEAGAPPSLGAELSILAEGAQTTAAIAGSTEPAKHARHAAETLIDHALRPRGN